MVEQSPSPVESMGCGVVGCLGGLTLGLLGGTTLLILASFINALLLPAPATPSTPAGQADIRLTVDEDFLNRYLEQPTQGSVQIDILPGNQVEVATRLSLEQAGQLRQIEIVDLFELQLRQQDLAVDRLDTQILGIDLPPDLSLSFSYDVALINQDLAQILIRISDTLGVPIIPNRIETDPTKMRLEIREVR